MGPAPAGRGNRAEPVPSCWSREGALLGLSRPPCSRGLGTGREQKPATEMQVDPVSPLCSVLPLDTGLAGHCLQLAFTITHTDTTSLLPGEYRSQSSQQRGPGGLIRVPPWRVSVRATGLCLRWTQADRRRRALEERPCSQGPGSGCARRGKGVRACEPASLRSLRHSWTRGPGCRVPAWEG